MYKYGADMGGKVSLWCKRIDRALAKLKAHNAVVHITHRKRTHNYIVHILCYDLATLQRHKYIDANGKSFIALEDDRHISFPVSYINDQHITGTYGIKWVLRITVSPQGGVKTAYSTYSHPESSNMITVNADDLSFNVLHKIIQDQFSSVPIYPQIWSTDKCYQVAYRLVSVDSIQSIPAMVLSAYDDMNKVRSILSDHLGIKLPCPDNIINVPEIISLPNN